MTPELTALALAALLQALQITLVLANTGRKANVAKATPPMPREGPSAAPANTERRQ